MRQGQADIRFGGHLVSTTQQQPTGPARCFVAELPPATGLRLKARREGRRPGWVGYERESFCVNSSMLMTWPKALATVVR